tara:strand:+ start:2026 stop:2463 length:438 start_codon:yes stop_codon:yes gene_type:complete
MSEHGENIDFLNHYLNHNINVENMHHILNNNPYIENFLTIVFNFACILTSLSILQWLFKTLYFYFCYDYSYTGIFTNIITIFNPFCYYLNLLQWKLSDYIIIITISILINSSRNMFNYFLSTPQYTQRNNYEDGDSGANDDEPPQ